VREKTTTAGSHRFSSIEPMADHILDFRCVEKSFGRVKAVDRVTFSLHTAEIFTLLGPSGCGKTTTLRLIAGLEEPDAGEIVIDNVTVAAPDRGIFAAPEKRRLGMVFQSYGIWPHLSVFENVAFPLRVRGNPAERIRQKVYEALQMVGLRDLAKRNATELSGGQQQRVALARALVYEPAILLLDEPLSNLDAKLREQMRGEIRALQKTLGLSILYVTHDQTEAMTLSDRIAVINGGRFEQIGSPVELYESPATAFVAEFLGRVVYLDGRISRAGARRCVELKGGGKLALNESHAAMGPDGSGVRVTLRPEDFRILPGGELVPDQIAGVIEQASYLGERMEYQVAACGVSFVLPAGKRERYRPGDIVWLAIDPGAIKLRVD
jgi:ABC-type Fe3+/spermidine/putrescine transport system ATPase subunit